MINGHSGWMAVAQGHHGPPSATWSGSTKQKSCLLLFKALAFRIRERIHQLPALALSEASRTG